MLNDRREPGEQLGISDCHEFAEEVVNDVQFTAAEAERGASEYPAPPWQLSRPFATAAVLLCEAGWERARSALMPMELLHASPLHPGWHTQPLKGLLIPFRSVKDVYEPFKHLYVN